MRLTTNLTRIFCTKNEAQYPAQSQAFLKHKKSDENDVKREEKIVKEDDGVGGKKYPKRVKLKVAEFEEFVMGISREMIEVNGEMYS